MSISMWVCKKGAMLAAHPASLQRLGVDLAAWPARRVSLCQILQQLDSDGGLLLHCSGHGRTMVQRMVHACGVVMTGSQLFAAVIMLGSAKMRQCCTCT